MEHYIHQYVISLESNPAETELNLKKIILEIEKNESTLSGLVVVLQEFLVSEEASIRSKGLSLLTGVLKGVSGNCITSKDVGVFSQFYVERLHDQYCLSELLHGLKVLLSFTSTCGPQDALKIVQGIFDNVRVQQLSQPLRLVCFSICTQGLISYPKTIKELGKEFAKSLVDAIDGEKDPRNLLVVFNLVKLTVQTCDVIEQIEDLFDVTFCYFPITFKAPKEDPFGVSPVALKEGLKEVLTSTPLFDSLAIPALLKTLSSSSLNAKKDALSTLLAAMSVYRIDSIASYLGELISSFTDEIYHPLDDDVQAAAFEITEALFNRLLSAAPISEIVETELSKAIGSATNQLIDKESKETKYAGRLILALARSGVIACQNIVSKALPSILQAYKDAELVTQRKLLLEVVAGLVNVYVAQPHASTDDLLGHQTELLSCFTHILGVISEYNELRKTAIEGLSALISLSSFADDEREFYTMQITQVYLSDEDVVVSQAALDGMFQLAKVSATKVILPQLFGCLEPLGQSPPQATPKAVSALEAIARLSRHQPLFQIILDRMIEIFDAACKQQNDPKQIQKILVCLQSIIEDYARSNLTLPNLLECVVLKLWKVAVFSSVGALTYTVVGSASQILEPISNITILALRWINADSQARFLAITHQLCFEPEKPDVFGSTPVALDDFFPFSASSPHARMSILFASALAPCRNEVGVPCSSKADFLSSLVELCFESQDLDLRKSCNIIIALILNKFSKDHDLAVFVSQKLRSEIKFIAFDYSASQARRIAALEIIIWASKGLVTLGHDAGFQLLDFIFMLLEDDVLGLQAAHGLDIILCDDLWFLCKANHVSIRLLYKQRVFSILFPIITALFNQETCRDEVKQNCLIALAALLNNSPQKILIREGKPLLPLLISCLKQSSELIQEAAIDSLFTLMSEGGLSESVLRLSFFYHDKPTLLETLITLATQCDGSKRRFGIQVRMGALKCLALFPSLAVSPSISNVNDLDPTAICRLVSQRLAVALDDPKRLVRAEAVKCRHKWVTVTISPK